MSDTDCLRVIVNQGKNFPSGLLPMSSSLLAIGASTLQLKAKMDGFVIGKPNRLKIGNSYIFWNN